MSVSKRIIASGRKVKHPLAGWQPNHPGAAGDRSLAASDSPASGAAAPGVSFAGDELAIRFGRFGIPEYDLFLQAKRFPEHRLEYHPEDETYTLFAPARFAAMLGVERPAVDLGLEISPFLRDYQAAIVRDALDAKRMGIWTGCGSGKTNITLELGRHIVHRTGGRFLICTVNDVVNQWIDEAAKFYGDSLPLLKLRSRAEMKEWMKSGPSGLAIANYEKWNHKSLSDQVVSEARHLAGIALDENRLKSAGGRQKWAIIKSCRGIEYKYSCTALPAPNRPDEYASQASFLEKMRSERDIIWTYFVRDTKTHRWTVKPHSREAFFRFMASWSIYLDDPRKYGWSMDMVPPPEPVIINHEIDPTPEQLEWRRKLSVPPSGQMDLFDSQDTNAIQRVRLSQVAKGFIYVKGQSGRIAHRIPSLKPAFVADLIRSEVAAGHRVLVWTIFDGETEILSKELGLTPHRCLTGKTKDADRADILDRFRKGDVPVLLTRAKMLGWGFNFQFVTSMVFSGWDDSFEAVYQAIRRAYRQGFDDRMGPLRVHFPMVRQLENDTLESLRVKEAEHRRSVADMEHCYIRARKEMGLTT